MNVMVAIASRHGSTRDIGDRVGARLYDAGFDVHLADIGSITTLDGVDAIVLGSAVYMGRWESAARLFVDEYLDELVSVPVWIFSSGPVGVTSAAEEVRDHEVAALALGPIDSRIFAGDLDFQKLTMSERFLCRLLHVPEGDYREWDEIDRWADTIAATLDVERKSVARRHAS